MSDLTTGREVYGDYRFYGANLSVECWKSAFLSGSIPFARSISNSLIFNRLARFFRRCKVYGPVWPRGRGLRTMGKTNGNLQKEEV